MRSKVYRLRIKKEQYTHLLYLGLKSSCCFLRKGDDTPWSFFLKRKGDDTKKAVRQTRRFESPFLFFNRHEKNSEGSIARATTKLRTRVVIFYFVCAAFSVPSLAKETRIESALSLILISFPHFFFRVPSFAAHRILAAFVFT